MFLKLMLWSVLLSVIVVVSACGSGADNSPTPPIKPAASPVASVVASTSAPKAKLNINTASQTDLMNAIPNLGSRMIHEFEEYRPYKSIQQFRKEIGKYVGQDQVAEYEKSIFVPIDENQSDSPTLQQIPGLDATEAQQIIAARPYASRDAFLEKLRGMVSADELAIAKTYLSQP